MAILEVFEQWPVIFSKIEQVKDSEDVVQFSTPKDTEVNASMDWGFLIQAKAAPLSSDKVFREEEKDR